MILGIGVDILEINRLRNIASDEKKARRIFSDAELEFANKKSFDRRLEVLAGAFSAKEAFIKALGAGLGEFNFTDIEIFRNEIGAPFIKLNGALAEISKTKNIGKIQLSISHDAGISAAFCVIEGA